MDRDVLAAHVRELEPAGTAAGRFAAAALADRTWEAYRGDWQRFAAWCVAHDVVVLPADPQTVADYLAAAAELVEHGGRPVYSAATIARWCSAINAVHRMAGHAPVGQHPSVSVVLAGIRRTVRRARPTARKAPLLLVDLVTVLDAMPRRWPGAVGATRDRALLLAGFAGVAEQGHRGDPCRAEADRLAVGGVVAVGDGGACLIGDGADGAGLQLVLHGCRGDDRY